MLKVDLSRVSKIQKVELQELRKVSEYISTTKGDNHKDNRLFSSQIQDHINFLLENLVHLRNKAKETWKFMKIAERYQ